MKTQIELPLVVSVLFMVENLLRFGYGLVSEKCPPDAVSCRIRIQRNESDFYEYSPPIVTKSNRTWVNNQFVCVLKNEFGGVKRSGCIRKKSGSVRCWCYGRSNCNTLETSRLLYSSFVTDDVELFRNTIELVDMDVKDRHSLISKPRASSFEVTNKAMTKTTATAARTGEPITSKEPDKDEPSQSDRPIETETTVFIDGKFGTTEASQKEPSSYEVPRIEEPTAKTSTESKEPSSMKTTQIFLSEATTMHFTTETPLATKTTTQTYSISDAEIDAHRTFFPDENEHSIGEDSGELLSDDYDEEFEDKEDSPTTKSPPLLAFDLGSISRAELETMDELRPAAAQFTGERVEKSKDDTSMKHMNHHTNHRKTPSPTVAHSHHYTSITGRVLLSNGHNTRFHHKEKTTPTVATVATLSQLTHPTTKRRRLNMDFKKGLPTPMGPLRSEWDDQNRVHVIHVSANDRYQKLQDVLGSDEFAKIMEEEGKRLTKENRTMYRYNRTKTTTTKYVDGDEDDTKDHPMETNNGRDSQEHLRIDSDRGGSSFSYDGRPKSVEEMSSNMVLRPDMYGDENLEEYFDSPLFFSSAVKFRATLFFIFLATLFNAAIIYNPFFFSL